MHPIKRASRSLQDEHGALIQEDFMQRPQYGLTAIYPGNKIIDTATLFASTEVRDDVDIPVLQYSSRYVRENADASAADLMY